MNKAAVMMVGLMLALMLPPAKAQPRGCPSFAPGTQLSWEEKRMPDLLFCRAIDPSGNEVFSLSVAHDYPFKASRSRREEAARINGESTWWYRTEVATLAGVEVRETAIRLPNGQTAYFNVQATSTEALAPAFEAIAGLRF